MTEQEKYEALQQITDYVRSDLIYKIMVFGGLEEYWHYEMGDIWAD